MNEIFDRLANDFEQYAVECLKVRSKSGAVVPFQLNKAQLYIHSIAEQQLRNIRKVRIIVCKGRQQGMSTYIQGRFYWRITHRTGQKAFILTHEAEATSNLFSMTQRFHENCNPLFKPTTGSSSANELTFDRLDSGYKVGTAGNKAVGRSSTIQYLHASEMAFYPHAEEHMAGILQAVPDEQNTEVWMESTANGTGDAFHQSWLAAESGESGYAPVFIPWFWQPEYRIVDSTFKMSGEERDLCVRYKLDAHQIAWRRAKIVQLGGHEIGERKFRLEYPMSAADAFAESDEGKLIPYNLVASAFDRDVELIYGYKPVWGLDVAGETTLADRTCLAIRNANYVDGLHWWNGKDTMQTVGMVKALWDRTPSDRKPSAINVDAIGIGAGVAARLREIGLPANAIKVSESGAISDRCNRLKDELWWLAYEWFAEKTVVLPMNKENEALARELSSVKYDYTSSGKLQMESKTELKKRGIRSTDLADAFCLTFASPLVSVNNGIYANKGQHQYDYDPAANW